MKSCWSLLWLACVSTAATAETYPAHSDVFISGSEGYFAFRIPAIETAPDGSLLAFAEARKYTLDDPGYGKQDIDLVLRRSTDRGRTWSPLHVIEDPGELWSAANPATVVDRQTGRVWLFYLRCKPERNTGTARPGTDDNQVLVRWSGDSGTTWSEPTDLTLVSRNMDDAEWGSTVVGPGGAIQSRSGRLLAPAWKFKPFGVFTLYSDDHGGSWQRGELVPGIQGGDESQLVELTDGRILFDIRQNSGPHRWMATSSDGGRTWTEPYAGNEVTPVACAIERLTSRAAGDERDRLLWTGPLGPDRKRLGLRVSYDEGRAFQNERLISEEAAAYSDLTLLPDRTMGCLWERGDYRFITFTRFDLSWIEPK